MKATFQILGLTLMFVLFACDKGVDRQAPTENLQTVAQELGLKFPPSTHLLGVAREKGMDSLVRAKVEMSKGEFDAFLASTPVDPVQMRPGARGFLGPDEGFWDPRQAKSLRTGQAIIPGSRALNIGVAEAGPERVVLYIVNHGT